MHCILPITLDNCFPEVVEKTKKVINSSETYRHIFWHTFVHGQYLEIVFFQRSLLYYNTLSWKLREDWCVCFDSHWIGFVSLSIQIDTGEMREKMYMINKIAVSGRDLKKNYKMEFTVCYTRPIKCPHFFCCSYFHWYFYQNT